MAVDGEPVAWFTECARPEIDQRLEEVPGPPVQVQRFFQDEKVTNDRITSLDARITGVPLLVPVSLAGRAIGHFTLEPEAWRKRQADAMGDSIPPLEEEPGQA